MKTSVPVTAGEVNQLDIRLAVGNTGAGHAIMIVPEEWLDPRAGARLVTEWTGAISGVVDDTSGHAISASITAIEQPSLKHYQTTSDSNGFYRFPKIPAGSYCMEVNVAGFGPETGPEIKTDVQVSPGHVTRVESRLTPRMSQVNR